MRREVRNIAVALAILLAVEGILFGLFYWRFHLVGYNGDALYDAQVARQIRAGAGYRTAEMPLYAVNLYEAKGFPLTPPWLNAHKFPLPAYVKAGLFALFGESTFAATYLYSLLFHGLALVTLFFLGLAVFKSVPKALIAGIIFLSHPALFFGTKFVMAGLNLVADTFFFLLLLLILVHWFERPRRWLLVTAGVVLGLAFLNRFNAALAVPVVAVWLTMMVRRQAAAPSFGSYARVVGLFAAGFAVTIAPYVWFSMRAFGSPLVSINGLFQLLFETPYNSFIDPWYKLEYVFPTANPFGFALANPVPLLVKWVRYFAVDLLRFATFERTWWWLLLMPICWLRTLRDPARRTLNAIAAIVLGWFGLQAVLLPFWSGNIVYSFFLFAAAPLFLVPALAVAWEFCGRFRAQGSALWRTPLAAAGRAFRDVPVGSASRRVATGVLSVLAFGALGTAAFMPLFAQLAKGATLPALLGVGAGLIAFAFVGYARPRLGAAILLAAMVISPLSRAGLFTSQGQERELEQRWDLEDSFQNFSRVRQWAGKGVVMAAAPWTVVWFVPGTASLPLPEYPDEIYLLETRYRQQIAGLYVNKLAEYPAAMRPYAWEAFDRMQQLGVAPAGYRFVERLPRGFIAERTAAPLPAETIEVDFGAADASSHLIWGWGGDEQDDQRSWVWAFGGESGAAPAPRHIPLPTSAWQTSLFTPQAEFTFLSVEGGADTLTFVARAAVPKQSVELVLNGNLFAADNPGRYLGKVSFEGGGWQQATVRLPKGSVRPGLNKLSLRFGAADRQGRAVAFDRVEFAVSAK